MQDVHVSWVTLLGNVTVQCYWGSVTAVLVMC